MFDVFLSHNSQDKAAVEAIATRLRSEAGLEPFLDKWHLIPGESWQPALEKALEASRTVAVFIGPSGISPWHNEEVRAALSTAVRTRDEYRIIPVLLPEADEKAVTGFLAQRTWVDFRGGLDKDEPFQRLVTGVKGVAGPSESFSLPDEPAPYRGLYKFQREHADRFFGRESEVEAVLQKLERSSFVVVFGASGAGKSSFVLAGLLPKLERLKAWVAPLTTLVLTPGASPLRALADRAVALVPPADRLKCADELEARMLQRADGLRTAIGAWAAEKPGTVVLVVDQMEELFTHTAERGGLAKVEAFAANLRDAVENGSGQVRVLATVRADFFERCLRVEPLRALLQDRDVLLGPMSAVGLRDVIVRPAAAAGAYFETGVVSAFMKELERRSEVLPMLEHALELLWRTRKGVWLTSAAYDAMGGVSGALKKQADECWARLPEADKGVARDIFLRLVSPGEGVPDTKRRVEVDELYTIEASREQVDRVLQMLSGPEARLLVVDRHVERTGAEVEVAHEILLQEWPTLRAWVDGARRKLRIHRRVTEATREWADNGRAHGYLLTGARLLEAEESFGPKREGMTQLEADLLAASIENRDGEARRKVEAQQARARVLRRSLVAVSGFALVALVAAGVAVAARARAEQEQHLARSRELAATALRELQTDPVQALELALEATAATDPPPEEAVTALRRALLASNLERVIPAHRSKVAGISLLPDGTVVSAGEDGTVRAWKGSSAAWSWDAGHSISALATSPDGRWVGASGDTIAATLDARDGRPARIWQGWEIPAGRVAVSPGAGDLVLLPDENRVVTLSLDGGIRGQQIDPEPVGTVERTAVSVDGALVAALTASGTSTLLDLNTGQRRSATGRAAGMNPQLAFSPDGRRLIVGDEAGVSLVDVVSGNTYLRCDVPGSIGAAVSADGRRLALTRWGGSVNVCQVGVQGVVATFPGAPGLLSYSWPIFSPRGDVLAIYGTDGMVRLLDSSSGKLVSELRGHRTMVTAARFSADGTEVITSGEDSTVRIWRTGIPASRFVCCDAARLCINDGCVQQDSPGGNPLAGIRQISVRDSGRRLIADTFNDAIELDVLTGRVLTRRRLLSGPNHLRTLAAWPDARDGGRGLMVDDDGAVCQGDDACVPCYEHAWRLKSAAISTSGNRVACVGPDGAVRIWRGADGTSVELPDRDVKVTTFSPDATILAVGTAGGGSLWRWNSRQLISRLAGHAGIESMSFRSDGRQLITVHADRTARVWSVPDSTTDSPIEPLAVLQGHADDILFADLSADGPFAVTTANDGQVVIWSTRTGDRLWTLPRLDVGRPMAAWFADGRTIATLTQLSELRLVICEVCATGSQLRQLADQHRPRIAR